MHSSAYMQTLKFLSKVWVKCFHHLVNHPAWHFMRRSKCASASVFLGDGANRFVWELFVTAFQNIQLFILWEWQVFKCKGVQRELQLQLSRLGGGVAGSRLSFLSYFLLWICYEIQLTNINIQMSLRATKAGGSSLSCCFLSYFLSWQIYKIQMSLRTAKAAGCFYFISILHEYLICLILRGCIAGSRSL